MSFNNTSIDHKVLFVDEVFMTIIITVYPIRHRGHNYDLHKAVIII